MKNLSAKEFGKKKKFIRLEMKLYNVVKYIINQLTPYINPDTPVNIDRFPTEISGSFCPSFQINIDFQDFEQYEEIVKDIDPNDPNKFYYIVARSIVIDKNETYFSNEVETIYLEVFGVEYEVTLELTLNEGLNRVELRVFCSREVKDILRG